MEQGSPNLSDKTPGSSRIDELERIVAQLLEANQRLVAELAESREQVRQLTLELDSAKETIAILKRAIHSPTRERFTDAPGQGYLFEAQALPGPTAAPDLSEPDASQVPPTKTKRKPHKRIVFPETLERVVIDHKLEESELPCSCCGKPRVIIREDSHLQLEIKPAQVYAVENRCFTYACPDCRTGKEMETTTKPPTALGRGILGPSFGALIVEWKYVRHVPLYRMQEILLGPLGQWVSRPLLCGMLKRTAEAFQPLFELIKKRVLSGPVIHSDDTTIPMLVKGVDKTKDAFLWGYGGGESHPIIFFDFTTSHSRAGPESVLLEYKGKLLTDGSATYTSLVKMRSGELVHACCWAHGRRKFFKAINTTSNPLAHEVLDWIQKMYDLEDQARDWASEARKELRLEKAKPILIQMKARLDQVQPLLRPSSTLADAVDYLLGHWKELNVYLEDGRIPIDNNWMERNFKAIATGKNYTQFPIMRSWGTTKLKSSFLFNSPRRYFFGSTLHNSDGSPILFPIWRAADVRPLFLPARGRSASCQSRRRLAWFVS